MGKEESCLEDLKKEYLKLQKKYNLPEFDKLNRDFEIEKATERETDFLIREIRKIIIDKAIAYLRFSEMLLNPTNAPLFFLTLVKGLTPQDKKILEKIYEKLGAFEIDVIELDIEYNEKDEADFIKKISKEWKSVGEDMKKIVEGLRRNWTQKSSKSDKGYLG